METDEAVVKAEPVSASSQASTASSTPVPTQTVAKDVSSSTTGGTVLVTKTKQPAITLPEVDVYLHLLVLLFAIDKQKYKQVWDLAIVSLSLSR